MHDNRFLWEHVLFESRMHDTDMIQTHKSLKRTLFILTKHNMQILGLPPLFLLFKLVAHKQQLNGEK